MKGEIVLLHILALAQATHPGSGPAAATILTEEEAARFAAAGDRKAHEAAEKIRRLSKRELSEALKRSLIHKTKLIYQEGHGVFIEYTAPDGELRMWYPGNVRVVRGSWSVRKMRGQLRPCFRYKLAVNPLTQVSEPTECVAPERTLGEAHSLAIWSGDVLIS